MQTINRVCSKNNERVKVHSQLHNVLSVTRTNVYKVVTGNPQRGVSHSLRTVQPGALVGAVPALRNPQAIFKRDNQTALGHVIVGYKTTRHSPITARCEATHTGCKPRFVVKLYKPVSGYGASNKNPCGAVEIVGATVPVRSNHIRHSWGNLERPQKLYVTCSSQGEINFKVLNRRARLERTVQIQLKVFTNRQLVIGNGCRITECVEATNKRTNLYGCTWHGRS